MRLRKTGRLLALLVGIGMLLAGNSQAAPAPSVPTGELWFLEVQFSGKGYAADTDNDTSTDPVHIEYKHKLEKRTIYAMYERDERRLKFAYDNDNETILEWETSNVNNVYETENKVLFFTQNYMTIHTDLFGDNVKATGTLKLTYKQKEGEPAKAKLKSLGMGYRYYHEKEIEGQIERIGVLKMKGKTIPQSEVPSEVLIAFGVE